MPDGLCTKIFLLPEAVFAVDEKYCTGQILKERSWLSSREANTNTTGF